MSIALPGGRLDAHDGKLILARALIERNSPIVRMIGLRRNAVSGFAAGDPIPSITGERSDLLLASPPAFVRGNYWLRDNNCPRSNSDCLYRSWL